MDKRENHMKMKTLLGLFCSLIAFYSMQLSATGSITSAKDSAPTVCQWLTREGRKLYLCGAPTDVAAMIKEAKHYQKAILQKEKKPSPIKNEITNKVLHILPLNLATPHQKKRIGYLVQAIGKEERIVKELVAIADKDYQILSASEKISLGVFSEYENALGRQKSLAAHGIVSKLIDRSLNSAL